MDVFDSCQEINDHLKRSDEVAARNILIKLLRDMKERDEAYPEVLNHLIRTAGLYPYMELDTGSWQQRYVHAAFEVDVGNGRATLHREQSLVLGKLLQGGNLAVSAPTSFGKSFIIDAFIALNSPDTVVIIVPTIALMDETRRRIFKKFSRQYSIITAPDTELGQRNIFIFPQERVFGYLNKIEKIDLLVIDEFYKASKVHDKERAPSLIKAIIKLSKKSVQRYYLAPNIKKLTSNIFTDDMEFLELLDFNTVFLEKHELFREIAGDEDRKAEKLVELIKPRTAKSLIYAGTYPEIDKVSNIVNRSMDVVDRTHTKHFAKWIRENYVRDWVLADLVERGTGVHNGNMHRCLSQIQIWLFEYETGLDNIISTSSIIEGVNTSAQNVIIWRSKIGNERLKNFSYKNIIGRGGRMFKHFVGNIYLLDEPPKDEDAQLEIEFPEQILGDLDEEQDGDSLTTEQLDRIIEYRRSMSDIVGEEEFARLRRDNVLHDSDSEFLLHLATNMYNHPEEWNGFAYLNSDMPQQWDRMLYKLLNFKRTGWESQYSHIVAATKAMSANWRWDLSRILGELEDDDIGIEKFFKLERTITYKLSALISDANELYKIIINPDIDVGRFVGSLSRAFLPGPVYSLEEYGLPRMISKKIQASKLIDFTKPEFGLNEAIKQFQDIGLERMLKIQSLSPFDRFVLKFFYDGITPAG
ncbi:DEAD/DEAH box helicase [Rhizobium rhizogenes]|uniref:DEAD/DEAH box helicase n=1 Tax=Rhizobium rhizogenes TaxID=359 RepID=UPI0015732657|nr:DEAD/DEAH box helicase [Rhizobium rhizogenes]NTF49099.1 DEAD/DEAH box helicase [Rhizobium rhizogenes]NTH06483.1 DEAD/DEAH box helicase [Rhizobium rhizogenes]